jgi:anti-anti-sigma factor
MLDIRLGDNGEIVITGRFDASQAEKVDRFLRAIEEPRIVDFSDLEYISSLGLGVLLKTQKRLTGSAGAGLTLVNLNKHVLDVFRYSGFERVFEIRPTDAE